MDETEFLRFSNLRPEIHFPAEDIQKGVRNFGKILVPVDTAIR